VLRVECAPTQTLLMADADIVTVHHHLLHHLRRHLAYLRQLRPQLCQQCHQLHRRSLRLHHQRKRSRAQGTRTAVPSLIHFVPGGVLSPSSVVMQGAYVCRAICANRGYPSIGVVTGALHRACLLHCRLGHQATSHLLCQHLRHRHLLRPLQLHMRRQQGCLPHCRQHGRQHRRQVGLQDIHWRALVMSVTCGRTKTVLHFKVSALRQRW